MDTLHIAAAAIINSNHQVLLALRPSHQHQGGLWEFPGGKLEAGEDVVHALRRELKEELDIEIQTARPLIKTEYAYTDRTVLLDVWQVSSYHGEAKGREGQAIRWVNISDLEEYEFPAADQPIITAISLPPTYLIGPEPDDPLAQDFSPYLARLEACLQAGVGLFQLRAPALESEVLRALSMQVSELCQRYGTRLMVNACASEAVLCGAHGVHLNSQRLLQLSERPLGHEYLVSASCHNSIEVEQARRIGVDFIVLGPVKQTRSHPDMKAMGWERFASLAQCAGLPVYALGGLQVSDTEMAWNCGAQGIAAIRGLWHHDDLKAAIQQCHATPELVLFIG